MPTPVTYPTLMPQPFASVSGTSTFGGVNPISTGSVSPFASLADGFPLLTMLPVQEGGVPPQGPDFNGILNWITQHVVYLNAGGQYYFSSALAIAIGGYPIGAVLQLNSHSGMVISTAANNTTDPNSSMVGWSAYGSGGGGGGSWPPSGTPSILTTLGSLANSAGLLANSGTGTLSWVPNPFVNGTAAPTVGTWAVGAICWNSGVTATTTPGWICTTAGTPGTWTPLPQTVPNLTLTSPASPATITMPGVSSTLPYFTSTPTSTNIIPYASGTAGLLAFATTANYGVLITDVAGLPFALAGAAGVLIGSASSSPTWSTSLPAAQFPTLTGDVTTVAGALATTLATTQSAAHTWSAAQTFSSTINNIMFTAPASTVTLALASGSSFTTTGAFTWGLSVPGAYTYTLPGSTSTLMATTTSVLAAQMPALTGDVTTVAGAVATTLATTQGAVHTWSLVQTFSATDVHTLGHTLTASAAVATNGYVGQDSTQKAMGTYQNGLKQMVVGCIFTQTATGTNGAATAITNILGTGVGTAVLPASYSLIGKTIRIKVRGTVTTATTPGTTVITLYLSAGAPVTVVAMSTAITPTASMTSMPFDIEFDMTFRTTTTAIGAGKLTINSATTAVSSTVIGITTITAATIVAATSYTIQVCSTNSVASGCVYTTQTCTMEVLQ